MQTPKCSIMNHLRRLQDKRRRERLEWLGDVVMQEIVTRSLACEALAALDRVKNTNDCSGVASTFQPLSRRFGEALSIILSNANLGAVYSTELGGLISSLGICRDVDVTGTTSRKRRRLSCSSVVRHASGCSSSLQTQSKKHPDLVEAIIGQAFEVCLAKESTTGEVPSPDTYRRALVDRLLSAMLSTEYFLTTLSVAGTTDEDLGDSLANQFAALDDSDCDDPSSARSDLQSPRSNQSMLKDGQMPLASCETTARRAADTLEIARTGAEASRQAVLRTYGAALVNLRVSVYLLCSAEGEQARSPRDLTLRRQRVMCANNLDAIAHHLGQRFVTAPNWPEVKTKEIHSLCHDETSDELPNQPCSPNILRVQVGHAALVEGNMHLSTRVAALLLTRAGERSPAAAEINAVSWSSNATSSAVAGHCRQDDARGPPEVSSGALPKMHSRTVSAHLNAEVQFSRRPWLCSDLPLTSSAAAKLLAEAPGRTLVMHDLPQSRSSIKCSADGLEITIPRRRREKRKRRSYSADSTAAPPLPPHYACGIDRVSRDEKQLLSRLGHHEYVKILEIILERFARAQRNLPPAFLTAPNELDLDETASFPDGDDEVWRALQEGTSHPNLKGLVEPTQLAKIRPGSLILPLPNPFYRRVLHALCSIHGLTSCGGDTNATADLDGAGRCEKHRTVEISTPDDGSGDGRAVDCTFGVCAGVLVPVEVLLRA